MIRYIPGLLGAVAAMIAFRLLTMLDFSIRMAVFLFAYLVVTITVDKALARYGTKSKK